MITVAIVTAVVTIGLVIASRLLSADKPEEPQRLRKRDLDLVAASYGLARKTMWWFFKETDSSLRARVLDKQRVRFSADRVRRRKP